MEMTAELQQEIQEFKMPNPARGQQVLWYQHASPSEHPEVAFVRKVGHKSIVIQLAGGICVDTVPHINDPRLRLNEDQRSSGAWDFPETERDIATLKQQVESLKSRMDSLEELLNEPTPKKQGK